MDTKNLQVTLRHAFMLAVVALFCTLFVSSVYYFSRERIQKQENLARNASLLAIISQQAYDNDPIKDKIPLPSPLSPAHAHLVRLQGKTTALVLPIIVPDGYTDKIDMLLGVNSGGEIIGARVIRHYETPGLGDQIDIRKSNWIVSFNGTSLRSPPPRQWKVKRDGGVFDQFTGATITPRAVVGEIFRTLKYIEKHRHYLFNKEGF